MYLIKNAIVILFGLIFSFVILEVNINIRLSTLSFDEYYLHFFKMDFLNIIIFIFIYFLIYYVLALLNYFISSYHITNYYSFVVGIVLAAFHAFILYNNGVNIDIVTFFGLISIQIFLSFFINYSTKYEKGNKNLIKDTF